MRKIINTLRALKDMSFLGKNAINIKDKFTKKVDITILVGKERVYDLQVPEKELNLYIRVLKRIPDCEIRI
jgi:hypothetical protein